MTSAQVLATGLGLGESPRWHDGRLWVCDWVRGEVVTVDGHGEVTVVHRVEGLPFSLDRLSDGRAVLTTAQGVVTAAPDGALTPYGGAGQSWNEIVVGSDDVVFVNCVGFDLLAGEPPRAGWVSAVTPDGRERRVAEDLAFPNGMALTPAGDVLLVAESYGHRLTAFDVGPEGGLSGRRTWADLGDGTPDGLCLDAEGAAWYADVPHRRCVRVREGGEVLDVVEVDRGCFSCTLGGEDGRTLFITAATWGGPAAVGSGAPTGQVLTWRAPAARAGRP